MDYYDAYGSVFLGELLLHAYRPDPTRGLVVTGITVEGQLATPDDSFWESLQVCFPEHASDAHATRGDWFDVLATEFGITRLDYQVRWYPSGEIVFVGVTRPATTVPPSTFPSHRADWPAPDDAPTCRITAQMRPEVDAEWEHAEWFIESGPGTLRISRN